MKNYYQHKYKDATEYSDKIEKDRRMKIVNFVPKDVKSVLDIGSGIGGDKVNFYADYFDVTNLDYRNAEINQDLHFNQKIPLKDNSVDCVFLLFILEHLLFLDEIIKESIRVAKKYVLVGLPNELVINQRMRILIGKAPQLHNEGYDPYGHHTFFRIKTIEEFINNFYGGYEKKMFVFSCKGGRYFPNCVKDFLGNKYPRLFASQIIYLIKIGT